MDNSGQNTATAWVCVPHSEAGVGMTGPRFDDLTKALSKGASRRSVLKALVAAAVGGVVTRGGGDDAEARARVNMACARLGQPCSTVKGTPGSKICCPHL